jgi:hypothetical protein
MPTIEVDGRSLTVPSNVVYPTPDRAYCRHCGHVKSAEDFALHKASGLRHVLAPCKSCEAEIRRTKRRR